MQQVDADEEHSCTGKAIYVLRSDAKSAARKTTRRYHLQTYRCRFCGFFHNGKPRGFKHSVRGRRYIDSMTVLYLPEELQ